MGRFGFPTSLRTHSVAAHSRINTAAVSAQRGIPGMTFRRGFSGGLGFSQNRAPRILIRPKNNPMMIRPQMSWKKLTYGRRIVQRGGSFRSASQDAPAGRNIVRQLIKQYGKVPKELRKDLRGVMRAGGLQLKRRAEWYWRASSRAQKAIKVTTSTGFKNAGTRVWVDNNVMPFSRAWERILGDNYYIHVPWGNYEAAQPRPNRPGLRPAINDVGGRIVKDMNRQMIKTINRFQSGRI